MKITPIIAFASCLWLLTCRQACAQVTNTIIDSTNFVNIGGRQLEIATYGQGQPTVVVEGGLGGPAVEGGFWKRVVDAVAKTTRICVYDRAGLGKSDAVTNALRTSQDMVNDLHKLLVNAKAPQPYILVAHSIGGFVVRLYASEYPDEVVGLVLVDTTHPDQLSKWLAALPPESANEPESIKNERKFLTSLLTDPAKNPERMDISTSSAQVRAAGNFGDKPLVVLSHSPDWRMAPDLPDDVSRKLEQISQNLQNDLTHLSSKSTHKSAAKAGHLIPSEDPQLVIEAILKVVDATQK